MFNYTHTTQRKKNTTQDQGEKSYFSDLAGIDVTDELGNALRRVCPLLQQDNRCGLERDGDKGRERKGYSGEKKEGREKCIGKKLRKSIKLNPNQMTRYVTL